MRTFIACLIGGIACLLLGWWWYLRGDNTLAVLAFFAYGALFVGAPVLDHRGRRSRNPSKLWD